MTTDPFRIEPMEPGYPLYNTIPCLPSGASFDKTAPSL
jgi:hypothetical protein